MPEPIYHLVPDAQWNGATSSYEPSSLAQEGFVHCCRGDQVARVAERLFTGRQDLLLLEIDPSRLSSEVVWEDLYSLDEEFPHVYGPIEGSAVVRVSPYPLHRPERSS